MLHLNLLFPWFFPASFEFRNFMMNWKKKNCLLISKPSSALLFLVDARNLCCKKAFFSFSFENLLLVRIPGSYSQPGLSQMALSFLNL